jgi:hypothetical protein
MRRPLGMTQTVCFPGPSKLSGHFRQPLKTGPTEGSKPHSGIQNSPCSIFLLTAAWDMFGSLPTGRVPIAKLSQPLAQGNVRFEAEQLVRPRAVGTKSEDVARPRLEVFDSSRLPAANRRYLSAQVCNGSFSIRSARAVLLPRQLHDHQVQPAGKKNYQRRPGKLGGFPK